MNKLLPIALAVLVSLNAEATQMSIKAAPEIKGSPEELKGFLYPDDKVVPIRAYAEQKAYSDKAIVSLVITTEAKLLSEAIAANSTIRADIASRLVGAGIDADKVKSSKFSSSPEYRWFSKKPARYKVVNRMAITIFDEQKLQAIAAIADESDEVKLVDTAFEHSKKDEFNQKVKAMTLQKIIKQKEVYEQMLGVQLVTIGISEGNIRRQATRGASVLEEVIVTARVHEDVESERYQAQASFDEVKYSAELTVDYKIVGSGE